MNSWPKTGCDLNPGPTAPESSTLTTRLLSHPETVSKRVKSCQEYVILRFLIVLRRALSLYFSCIYRIIYYRSVQAAYRYVNDCNPHLLSTAAADMHSSHQLTCWRRRPVIFNELVTGVCYRCCNGVYDEIAAECICLRHGPPCHMGLASNV